MPSFNTDPTFIELVENIFRNNQSFENKFYKSTEQIFIINLTFDLESRKHRVLMKSLTIELTFLFNLKT